METNIYLVRHAEISYIPDEYARPLSEKGKQDVLRLTELFRSYKISHIFSSPYQRAVNTIKHIAREKKLDIELIDDFRERKLAEGYIEDFESVTEKQWRDFDFSLQGGESLKEAQIRGVGALNTLLQKYSGSNILVGTHGTILALILNYFYKKYDYGFWKSMNMPDVFCLRFEGDTLVEVIHIEF